MWESLCLCSRKRMNTHRIILGALFFVIGALFFIIVGMTFVNNAASFGIIQGVITLVFVASFFLMSFAGFGLLRNKVWAYFPAQIAAYINILNIPIGTAMAIYYIWFHRSFIKERT